MGRAKVITAEEREAAEDVYESSPITTGITPIGDADSEAAWDDWIDALKNSEAAGTVRAHRLPVDADGNPMLGKGTRQIYLGSWPHQLYAFDDLLAKLTREFLKPGETAHVKLTGTTPGHRGVMFSRVLTLQRADGPGPADGNSGETVGQLFRMMQESQTQQLQVLRETMGPPLPPVPPRNSLEWIKDVAGILTPILGPAIAAYIARPAKPKTDLGELIGAMVQMKEFMTGTASSADEESSTVSIIKAVAPALPQLLQILNQNAPRPVPQRPMIPNRPTPQPTADLSAPSRPVPMPPPPSQPPTEVDAAMLAQLKPQIDQLVELAKQNVDPAEVAKLTVTMLPENMEDALANLVADPATFNRLAVLSPAMAEHTDWFERLRLALHAELFEADDGNAAS